MANYAISNVPRRVVYAASGTGPYAFTFEILAASDIAVYKGDTLLTLTTDYTVTINANGTGSVTLTTSAGTSAITIVGSKTIARTTDFTTGGDFFANTLNDELDAQTIFIQQVAETAERGLKAPVTDPTDINMTLPRKADRAGKYLAFDVNGNPAPGPTAVDIDTVVGISADITTVSGISSQVTTVASNNANVTTVATNIANVNTNATNIASINTNASNIAAIQNASTNASTATTKASEAAASAILANDWATKTSAPVAGGEYSAKYHANAASSSASSASSSAADALTAKNAAEAALDSFDDRYLGAKSANPTVDNDGNALITGALHFNTTAGEMRIWNGTTWVAATVSPDTISERSFAATAGQTSYTFTGGYRVGFTYVWVNGVLLDAADITATNGTTITFASALNLNDEVRILTFKATGSIVIADITGLQTALDGKQASDAELTTLAGMSASRASFLASENSFTFRNRIINGAMVIDQRNAGASVTIDQTGGIYTLDRWYGRDDSDGAYSIQQVSDAPTGFKNSLKITITTTDTSLSASQYGFIGTWIEGLNCTDLSWGTASAKTMTLSFWTKSSVTGQFGGSITNSAQDRSYPFSFTISAANTWEYKTVTVTGDTTGTWLTTNGAGIGVNFAVGIGSNFLDTANTWAGSFEMSATGQTNLYATLSNTLFFTGVQLEVGSTATSFDYRPYGTELALCQRYYQFNIANSGYATTTTGASLNIAGQVQMRTAPTFTLFNGTSALVDYGIATRNITSLATVTGSSPNGMMLDCNCSTTTASKAHALIGGSIAMSSEL